MSLVKNLFSSPKAPEAPSPGQVASAQGAANEGVARLQAKLNRADTYTPYGSVTFSDLGDDRWKSEQTFSPEMQGLFDQQMDIGAGINSAAQNTVGQLPQEAFSLDGAPDYQSGISYEGLQAIPGDGDFEAARQAAADAAFNRVWGRLGTQFDDEQRALETQLANQGIPVGSEAYTREMERFNQNKNDARINAGYDAVSAGEAMRQGLFANALQARGQGIGERSFDMNANNAGRQNYINEQLLQRTQRFNELAALLQGAPAIQGPQQTPISQVGVAPPDVTGAYGLAQAANQNAYNQQVGQQNALTGGLASLGGIGLVGAMGGFS